MDAAAFTYIARQSLMSSAPLLIAGYGELIAQRAGVINVSIEGTMLAGAMAAFAAANIAGTSAAAFPAAIAAGILMAALFAVATVWCRSDQIVAGTALNLLAAGATVTANKLLVRTTVPLYEPLNPSFLRAIPHAGGALADIFSQYALFYVAVVLAIALTIYLRRSRVGLVIQGLGDAPAACQAAGFSVRWWRTFILLLAGAASGAAGAYLSTMRSHEFVINMTSGQGFLVLALVIFGRWRIWGFVLGTLSFSIIDGLQIWLNTASSQHVVPPQLFLMLPYLATLAALAVLTKSRGGPLFLGKPWPDDR